MANRTNGGIQKWTTKAETRLTCLLYFSIFFSTKKDKTNDNCNVSLLISLLTFTYIALHLKPELSS